MTEKCFFLILNTPFIYVNFWSWWCCCCNAYYVNDGPIRIGKFFFVPIRKIFALLVWCDVDDDDVSFFFFCICVSFFLYGNFHYTHFIYSRTIIIYFYSPSLNSQLTHFPGFELNFHKAYRKTILLVMVVDENDDVTHIIFSCCGCEDRIFISKSW